MSLLRKCPSYDRLRRRNRGNNRTNSSCSDTERQIVVIEFMSLTVKERITFQKRVQVIAVRYWETLSFVGVIFAGLLFATSMTPSLLPRSFTTQGLLSGFAAACGYACGVLVDWTWRFLQFRPLSVSVKRRARLIALASAGGLMIIVLWRATSWQNSIRGLMEMPPVASSYAFSTAFLAAVVGVVLITVGRGFVFCSVFVAQRLKKFVPDRLAYVLAACFVLICTATVSNNLVARSLLNLMDASFAKLDRLTDKDVVQPVLWNQSGSDPSLIEWNTIGRRGKRFVAAGPTAKEISNFHQKECVQPLRIYVGLNSRPTMRQRAQLALEELKRTEAFQRSVLVVATPTGTGWIDPSAADTLEYLHAGDTAIVALQYSYLPSWLTITVDPERSTVAARLLFDEIYRHWKNLPKESRPKLYLHGLSLGALGSELSTDVLTIFEDPIDGALWSGPPFPSRQWELLTQIRNEGSPAWKPEIRDSRMVRFYGQSDDVWDDREWGPIRNIYLQYASDPMVFFSPDLLFEEPDWLQGERGPDVSPYLKWVPVVTCLQIAFDLPLATNVPLGYGHNYAPEDYIDAWVGVTNPSEFTEEKRRRLKDLFRDRRPASFLADGK